MRLDANEADNHAVMFFRGPTDPPGIDFHDGFVDLVNLEFKPIQGFLLAGRPCERGQTCQGVARQHTPKIADKVPVVVVTGWLDQIELDFRFHDISDAPTRRIPPGVRTQAPMEGKVRTTGATGSSPSLRHPTKVSIRSQSIGLTYLPHHS